MPKRKVEKRKRSKSETESTSPKTNNSNTSKNIVSLKGSKEESIPQKPKVKINTSELPINFEEDGYDISENSSANNLGSDGELSEEEVVVKEVDSDDEIIPLDENTIGNVPIRWYDEYDHIGYNIDGEKILRPEKRDKIDEFLDQDDGTHWRKVWDEKNQREITLTDKELQLFNNIRSRKYPDADFDPYQEWIELPYKDAIHPVANLPEPKSRFIPSKWEAKKIAYLIGAIKKGWIKLDQDEKKEEDNYYLIWDDDQSAEKNKRHNMHIPAPKPKLPTHNESYNPPDEFLLNEQEKKEWDDLDHLDRPFNFIPQKYDRLRHVPAYANGIKERFERCLDLYLCPRTIVNRQNVDPESLLPKLPNPKDLMPFPTTLSMRFLGHTDKIRSISFDPTGQWITSGSDDKTVKVWEIATGRCVLSILLPHVVQKVCWNPNSDFPVILAAAFNKLFIINPKVDNTEKGDLIDTILDAQEPAEGKSPVKWEFPNPGQYPKPIKVVITHEKKIEHVTWHAKGDYFASVCPEAVTTAVLIHRLSFKQTQTPFKKNKGRVQTVEFHPTKHFFFVATQRYVRVYNLLKQQLVKKLMAGVQWISSLSVHPGGDNLIIGSYDKRVCWFDLDLSTKPYKVLRYHSKAVRSAVFHTRYPLFLSCSDDGTVHVFHGMVYNDLLQNALIVPVKILKGHEIVDDFGVLDAKFHPTQPWLASSGADAQILLFT